jgi:hypothetical protein
VRDESYGVIPLQFSIEGLTVGDPDGSGQKIL